MTQTKTLSVQQSANKLGVSAATIRRWLHDGILRGRRVGPRLLRIETASVENLESGALENTQEGGLN